MKNVLSVAAILAALMIVILIASFSMIYNAFALSFSEQVKYLGMLSSVGATKWQKKKALYFEGAVLGGIGIPLGILLGTAGTAVMQKILNSKITAFLTEYNICSDLGAFVRCGNRCFHRFCVNNSAGAQNVCRHTD